MLTVYIGDHRQTPGGLSKGRAAVDNRRKLIQCPLGLRALDKPGDYLPPGQLPRSANSEALDAIAFWSRHAMFPFAFCFCLVLFGVWVVGVCFLLCLCWFFVLELAPLCSDFAPLLNPQRGIQWMHLRNSFISTTRCDDLARATEAQDGKKSHQDNYQRWLLNYGPMLVRILTRTCTPCWNLVRFHIRAHGDMDAQHIHCPRPCYGSSLSKCFKCWMYVAAL